MERAKMISKTLESVFRMSCNIDFGVILNNDSYLLRFTTEDPLQSTSRSYFKAYGNATLHIPSARHESLSPSRALKAMVRQSDGQVLEIWDESRLLKIKNLRSIHSDILSGQVFGGPVWSSDEKLLAYIAEATPTRSGNFWSSDKNPGNQNLYKEQFGEGFYNVTSPTIYVYNRETNQVEKVPTEDIYPAQLAFKPGTNTLVFVGYLPKSFKTTLSSVNRETRLFAYDLDTKTLQSIEIAEGLMGGLYPKFNPSGSLMTYYGVPSGTLSHCFCMPLYLYNWESSSSAVLIDVVEEFNSDFNGIYGYLSTISKSQWLTDELFVFQSLHKVTESIYTVDISGKISQLPIPFEVPFTANIMNIHSGKVLFSASNYSTLPKAFVGEMANGEWNIKVLEENSMRSLRPEHEDILTCLQTSKCEVIKHENSPLESLLYYTSPSNPLIVLIHGGPHGGISSNYVALNAVRLFRGFNILNCNYRGSTGFGAKTIRELLGNIGGIDFEDVMDAIRQAGKIVEVSKVISYGTSYGGFLSTYFASTDTVVGSVSVNGALNLALNLFTTDDPSWIYSEVFTMEMKLPPNQQQIQEMFAASPIARVEQVKVPVFLAIGGNDQCVSPQSTIGYYKMLKALGKEVVMYYYEKDGHSIANRASSYDLSVNVLKWMEELTSSGAN